jgi:hypothetical protein
MNTAKSLYSYSNLLKNHIFLNEYSNQKKQTHSNSNLKTKCNFYNHTAITVVTYADADLI